MLKAISGHTSTKGIRRYLTKKNRALAEDCLNLDPPEPGRAFDWAAAMDETRRLFGNDSGWRGRRARTYKPSVVSPDPKDGVSLDGLRALATRWAQESFPNHEVAIDYHEAGAGADGIRGKLQKDPHEVGDRHVELACERLGRDELTFGHAQVHLLGAPFQTAARLLGTWA